MSIFKKHLILLFLVTFSACKKDKEVDPTDDNELITTIKLNFTNNGVTKSFLFEDKDGEGGNAPTKFEKIILEANKQYDFTIQLLDESKSPAVNISDIIAAEEKDQHLFLYNAIPITIISFSDFDKDKNNFNVGLTAKVNTTRSGTGKLKVQLRHQPPINGKPTKDGTSTPGSDDINLDFDLEIK
jgi:hypothetical protein